MFKIFVCVDKWIGICGVIFEVSLMILGVVIIKVFGFSFVILKRCFFKSLSCELKGKLLMVV